ncbi:MAG: DUF4286 family protein [Lysobacter sp.]|nr:DUF4286 family protein [Lysobacter sp.]
MTQYVIYEVAIEADAIIADDYRTWLDTHVRAMLVLPGFVGARVYEAVDPPPTAGTHSFCVQYRLQDQTSLDRYMDIDAPRMRAEGIERFGQQIRTSRRVLQETHSY